MKHLDKTKNFKLNNSNNNTNNSNLSTIEEDILKIKIDNKHKSKQKFPITLSNFNLDRRGSYLEINTNSGEYKNTWSTFYNNTETRESERRLTTTNQNEPENIKTILNKKKKVKIEENLKEKKDLTELNDLKKERGRLSKSYELTKDIKSLALLSNKVMRINVRITKIMKKLDKYDNDINIMIPTEEDEDEDKISQDDENIYNTPEKDGSSNNLSEISQIQADSEKSEFKNSAILTEDPSIKSNNFPVNIKNHLKFDFHSIEHLKKTNEKNNKINQIRNEVNMLEFNNRQIHKTNANLVTEYPSYHFSRTNYHPKLFHPSTQYPDGNYILCKSYRPKGFRNENKNLNSNQNIENFKYNKNLDDILYDNEYQTEFKKSKFNFFTENKQKLKSNLNSKNNLDENSLKKFYNLYLKALGDSKVINNHIKKNRNDVETKIKLEEKIKLPKTIPTSRTHEEEIEMVLKRLPKPLQNIYHKVYKQILFEDRLLNKNYKNEISEFERVMDFYKMKKELQKISQENMLIMRTNLDDDKDDEIKKKILHPDEDYEWIQKKKRVMKTIIAKIVRINK